MNNQRINSIKLLPLILIVLMMAGMPSVTFAHAILVESEPKAESSVDTPPDQIKIWFNENVASEFKSLAVINSAGKRVDNNDVKQAALDRSHIYATVPKLPPDTYTVRYRVMSADTHIITGKFTFTVASPEKAEIPAN